MIDFLTRNFSSLWAMITYPFRAMWRIIERLFPPREFTVMDIPRGNVYAFQQGTFWRFTKFCGKMCLIIWATWSTYIFMYHRPLLQKRTQQLEQVRAEHARQMSDLKTYLAKYNELTRNLNVTDDKILNSKNLSDSQKDSLLDTRIKTWAELDFLHTRISEMFSNANYAPEYTQLSELSTEYELTRAENQELKKRNNQITENVLEIADADIQITNTVTKMTSEKNAELHKQLQRVTAALGGLGITENTIVSAANDFSSPLVGSVFNPLEIGAKLPPKYQKLANDLELWHGLSRLTQVLPLGAPVEKMTITSRFGTRTDPFNGRPKMHRGVDFSGAIGTKLMTVAPGRVISAGERVGYGTTVEIDHGLGFTTLYAHLSQITVSRGDWVRPGTVIGLAGSSGRSTGPHLHYEIRYKGNAFDPINFVKE